MSSNSTPISPARFAAALQDLPISSIYAKAAELTNSITYLRSSNAQLHEFAAAGDADCAEAVRENAEVIARMEERIGLCREEVEVNRGLVWETEAKKMVIEGNSEREQANGENGASAGAAREDGDGNRRQDGDGGGYL